MAFLLLIPVFGFLAAGCVAFMFCASIPPLRRFALGVALWLAVCAVLSPVAIILNLTAIGVLARADPHLMAKLDLTLLHHFGFAVILNAVAMGALASLVVLVHGWLTRRTTLYLFRIYLTSVSIGVGVLSAFLVVWSLAVADASQSLLIVTGILSIGLPVVLSLISFHHAVSFRSGYPEKLNLISPEEYGAA